MNDTLLVPTDFSEQANMATDTAHKIAKIKDLKVHFVHATSLLPRGWEGWPDREKDKFPEARRVVYDIEERLTSLVQRFEKANLTATYSVSADEPLGLIESAYQAYPVHTIVMGSHGVSGKREYFIGSNTQKVIRKLEANIFIVKEKIEKLSFEKVLFCSHLSIVDEAAFKHFLSWVEVFKPKEVHLLTINLPGFSTQPYLLVKERFEDYKQIAKEYHLKTHFIRDFTVEGGIRLFSEKMGIDLIGISNLDKNPIKRIFLGSNVEMLANHSEIPVLSIGQINK